MAQRANIILADGQDTPVNHTFTPTQDAQKGVSVFQDKSGGVPSGYPLILLKFAEPAPYVPGQRLRNDRIYKSDVRIIVPTLETVSNNSAGYTPAATPAYACMFRVQSFVPERATLQERKDLRAYAKNWLAHAVAASLYEENEGVY